MTDATTTTTTTTAADTAAAAAAAAASAAAKPWFEGKIDAETVEYFKTNKGFDVSDPAGFAGKLAPLYRNVEKMIGAKPEELVRWPKDAGDGDNWKNVYTRLGVPKEPKDYDLSTVKLKDGKDIEPAFADVLRASLHKANTPKESAAIIAKDIVDFQEGEKAAALAEKTAYVQKQEAELDKMWGTKKPINMVIANEAWSKLAAATGLTAEEGKKGWDAISKSGAADASIALRMLFTIGAKMGEAPFIGGERSGDVATMSREGAQARIRELQADPQWSARFKAGGQNSKEFREWQQLHAVAAGIAA